jgi:Outer membrane protein beta-barrel domain
MKKSFAGLLSAAALLAAAAPAAAQIPAITPFSFEVRAGLALPQGDLGDALETGWSLGGTATYHFFPTLGVYAGYSMATFGAGDEIEEEAGDGTYRDSGFDFGLRFAPPTPLIPIDPWIRAGGVYHKLEAEDFDDPEANGDTDSSLGFQVGAGLGFGFGPISLTPGVIYTRYDVEDDEGDEGTVEYFALEIGGRIRL